LVLEESLARGYRFDRRKVRRVAYAGALTVTRGQLRHEWRHLLAKLAVRDAERRRRLQTVKRPRPHPLFRVVAGDIETWERR
jgi:hypothetical protein